MSRDSRTLFDLDFINLDAIMGVQKHIDYSDMISLMFLLYEDPQKAFKKLLVYQRISVDVGKSNCDLLCEWAALAHTRRTWKWELLEALATCQLYAIIRKLGLDTNTVKQLFHGDNAICSYINPTRKMLYRVCENMDDTSWKSFMKIINSEYRVNITDYAFSEILFLELMCLEIFTPVTTIKVYEFNETIQKLLHILDKIPSCKTLCFELRKLSRRTALASNIKPLLPVPSTSNELPKETNENTIYSAQDFDDVHKLINELSLNNLEDLKTDDRRKNNAYGLCYIINQEQFSSNNTNTLHALEDRPESSADKAMLEETMKDHHIEVIAHDNLSRDKMFCNIKHVIKNRVMESHRIFLLCILSHGTRDHVYSAKSERVKICDIEELLDSDDAALLRIIPKVLIVEACQVDDNMLAADSAKHYIKKSNMITFCSTAPGYEAFRLRGRKSIFIDSLCKIIQKYSSEEHLTDLFTKVIEDVYCYCSDLKVDQLPIILRNTLKKKIYLKKLE